MFLKRSVIVICILAITSIGVFASGEVESVDHNLPDPQVEIDRSKPGWEQDTREVTFDWYINFPWYAGKWGQDIVTQYITELTGVNVNFIIPAGNPNEKLNTLIVSDSLPDLITIGWWEDIAKSLQDPKFTYNLEALAEAYDPYFFEVSKQGKRDWYRQQDGGVYGYPNASYSPEDYANEEAVFSNDTFMVRKDVYEAIGSPDMTTPEGFIAALEAAKSQFPTLDGQPIIPIGFSEFGSGSSSLREYLQRFLAVPDAKDGALNDKDLDSDYITWLKTFRLANEKGLVSRDVFSDTRQQIEEKMTQGRYFAVLYPYIDAIVPLSTRYNDDPNSSYIAVAGPKNSKGSEHELSGPGISGWTLTMISKKNKDPEKAIRFLSFLLSEKGIEIAFLGKQGVTWDFVNGEAKFLPKVDDLRANNRAEFDKTIGADWMLWMGMDTAYQFLKYPIPAPPSYNSHRQWTVGKVKPRFEFENIEPLGSSDLGVAQAKINGRFSETIPQLILAESDAAFDEVLADFVEFRSQNSFDELQSYRTERYRDNTKKLGL